ncbi:DUF4176 domain-containing protein [Lactococcus ileimucosae]|uniref:DUF4176 domain-containing protein n=1 Tax=Lactococcus ileimucosae TaxID=2941329 RepID=UPI002043C5D0|nr:DUF4176 domain-containing protein [Lactococcus ileimucosae]
MQESKKLLPLGSLVYLKEGTVKMLIIGRSNLLNRFNKEKPALFDYSAVMYPMGYAGEDKVFFFNHEDIDEIEFEGYTDSENEQYLKNMKEYQEKNSDTFIREDVSQFLEENKLVE